MASEAGRSEGQGYPQLYNQGKANLGYMNSDSKVFFWIELHLKVSCVVYCFIIAIFVCILNFKFV